MGNDHKLLSRYRALFGRSFFLFSFLFLCATIKLFSFALTLLVLLKKEEDIFVEEKHEEKKRSLLRRGSRVMYQYFSLSSCRLSMFGGKKTLLEGFPLKRGKV